MLSKGMTVKDAAERWVNCDLNAFPSDMIATLINADPDSWEEVTEKDEDTAYSYDGYLPIWGWLWQFKDSIDSDWAEEHIREISNCGFRIYRHEDWGLFLGVDGAGYDFYEAHWIPLYKAHGLEWHDPETEMKGEKENA